MLRPRPWLLSPLLALCLLLPTTVPTAAASAAVIPCVGGGSLTLTPTGNVQGVALTIPCKESVIATQSVPGSTSTQTFYNPPPANASLNGSYCAANGTAADQIRWDPITVTRSGNLYTLTNSASPAGAPGQPLDYQNVSNSWVGGVWNDMWYQHGMYVEATGDAVTPFNSDFADFFTATNYSHNGEDIGDAASDSSIQQYIVAGPIYYEWVRTGATWNGGIDPINNWATKWVYSNTTSSSTNTPTTFNTVWPGGYNPKPPYTSPSTVQSITTIVAKTGTSKVVETVSTYFTTVTTAFNFFGILGTTTATTNYTVTKDDHYNLVWYIASITPGKAPTCSGGKWSVAPGTLGGFALTSANFDTGFGPDPWIVRGASRVANPPITIPSSWTTIGNLTANVNPGSFRQTLGQPRIQVVGIPFPYAINNQSYSGANFAGSCSLTPGGTQQCVLTNSVIDPASGVQYFVTMVSDIGLVGVKWDWGDPGATAPPQAPVVADQTLYPPLNGLGTCSPAPWCGPQHTPNHIGNFKINVFEYYGSSIWAYYYNTAVSGVVAVNYGTGLPAGTYAGCKADPNPSVRPGGASFCLTPTPAPPGTPEVLAGGIQTGGYPYSVGQVEGVPTS